MKFSLLILIISVWIFQTQGAPLKNYVEEEDPELTGDFFEGDMEIDILRNGVIKESRHWPNGVVPYKLDDVFDADHQNHIKRAMQIIEGVSCIRFRPATENETNYVNITGEETGCHSNVGYLGQLQNLNLKIASIDKGCFILGKILHEFFHTLGFFHQQSASTRDDYVIIVEENIKDGKEGNFKKYNENFASEFGINYDYSSITHYGPKVFSKNGESTIVPLHENANIGQRRELSQGDIAKLNIMYKCHLQN